MAAAESIVCSTCQNDDVNSVAVIWCSECDFFFCYDCEEHHKKVRGSKDHKTMPVKEYRALPSFIVQITKQCKEHNKLLEFYCIFHESPCCRECIIETHSDCWELRQLSEVLTGVKSSTSVSHFEADLDQLRDKLEETMAYLKIRLDKIDQDKRNCIDEIKRVRQRIITNLDKLEKELLDELNHEHSEIKSKLETFLQQVGSKSWEVQNLRKDFVNMTQFANELQTFIGIRELEQRKIKEEEFLNILDNNDLNEQRLQIHVSSDILAWANCRSFGMIEVCPGPSSLCLSERQNQIPSTIVNLKPDHKLTISIPTRNEIGGLWINSCIIFPGGHMILLDQVNECLMLFDRKGTFIKEVMKFTQKPVDICYISQNRVAVTIFLVQKIRLVDTEKTETIQTFKVEGACYGIDSDGDSLFVRLPDQDIVLIFNLEGKLMGNVEIHGRFLTRIALFKDHIYCTNWETNEVSCYSTNGEIVWTYKHKDIQEPYGIAIDAEGFVFVASRRNNLIVVVSPNGDTSRILLTGEDGIRQPAALHIDKSTSTLLVCNSSDGSAFLFTL